MISRGLLTALVVAGAASAQNDPCTAEKFTINSNADFSAFENCQTLKGNVILGSITDAKLDLTGPARINGDLVLENNGVVSSFSSSTLMVIDGTFKLNNLTLLTSMQFPKLATVGNIVWQHLTHLNTLQVSVTKATSIEVSDTFLDTLTGLDVTNVDTFDLNNNRRLATFESKIQTVSKKMSISANSGSMSLSLPNLLWAVEMSVANVTEASFPRLSAINGSMRMDSNLFKSFAAPNLTMTDKGDIAFISNKFLTNISMPALATVGGGFALLNNSALETVDGFPKLKTVGGAVKLKGAFKQIDLPALNDVKGAFDVASNGDIKTSCDKFDKLAPSKQGGGGQIQGTYSCKSNDDQATSDTSTGTGSSGSGGTSKKGAASSANVNMSLLTAVSLLGLARLFL